MPAARRPLAAILGGVGLLAVAAAAVWAGRGSDWGRIQACVRCGLAGQALAHEWVEVPANDSWAVSLEAGLGVVVRGPARFEVAGPKPGEWRLALSRGTLFAQSAGAGKAVVLLPRDAAQGIEGATVSTGPGPGPSRVELDAAATGTTIRCGAGSMTLVDGRGSRSIAAAGHWETGKPEGAAPTPTAQEQGWLDDLIRR